MESGWERLGRLVRMQREKLRLTQAQAAKEASISELVWSKVENAKQATYRLGTLTGIERALRWAPGTIDKVLNDEGFVEIPETIYVDGEPVWAENVAYSLLVGDPLEPSEQRAVEQVGTLEVLRWISERVARDYADLSESIDDKFDAVEGRLHAIEQRMNLHVAPEDRVARIWPGVATDEAKRSAANTGKGGKVSRAPKQGRGTVVGHADPGEGEQP